MLDQQNLMQQIQQMSQTIQKNEQEMNMQKLLQQQAEFDQQIAASQVNIEVVSGSKGTHR